jgi:transcriptional regulator with XRE-family HTH domain
MQRSDLNTLGSRIRHIRKSQHLTQREIADKANIDIKYYGRIERGLANITFTTLVKVADALGVCPGAVAGLLAEYSATAVDVFATVDRLARSKDEFRLRQVSNFLKEVLMLDSRKDEQAPAKG